jgi:serine/threonine-protein kinase
MSAGLPPDDITRAAGAGFDLIAELDALLELPADARARRLGEIDASDPNACLLLQRWLAADAEPALPTLDPARYVALLEGGPEERETEASSLIGPWRLLRELGRGGMGSVWLAERADGQYQQAAALKLIKRGMDSDAIQARFLSERRILATLEHPNIARLLDGGIAADGRPYFAMEYVSGVPLQEFARQGQLDLRQRLALFLKLCHAVAYAHNRLVVHRDLKPSNVLVGADGEPKLLDFGIAKLLDDSAVAPRAPVNACSRRPTPRPSSWRASRSAPRPTCTRWGWSCSNCSAANRLPRACRRARPSDRARRASARAAPGRPRSARRSCAATST